MSIACTSVKNLARNLAMGLCIRDVSLREKTLTCRVHGRVRAGSGARRASPRPRSPSPAKDGTRTVNLNGTVSILYLCSFNRKRKTATARFVRAEDLRVTYALGSIKDKVENKMKQVMNVCIDAYTP